VPIETEVRLGESIAGMYEEQGEVNDSASYYVGEFVKRLDLDDTYKIDVKVLESKDINAFALPGGKIFIYSGIIDKMSSYEELVALLGHEVTHVTNRHSLKSICRSAATSIFIASLFGDVTGVSSGILSQADEFRQLHYSRELETEADANGVNLMVQNKVSPQGMIDLLELLKNESVEMPQFMKYLSTHPDTDSRINNVFTNPEAKTIFPENEKFRQLFIKLKRCI
jgi:predicted Zn-dependent protease